MGLRRQSSITFGSAKNFYCCRSWSASEITLPLEVLRISTVVDIVDVCRSIPPLEVLRISTVVDLLNSRKQRTPLEVLRISTVVDTITSLWNLPPLEVLRISTVVDRMYQACL